LRTDPISEAAIEAVMEQVAQFLELVVETYSSEIATDEVGTGGTARATDAPILGARPPRILLYGRVQSGKTVAMILSTAVALDNGFRVVVILTSDNVALVNQTASRLKNLDGPRVLAGVKDGGSYEWEGQEEQLRGAVLTDGIVLVCAKNAFNLPQVLRLLRALDASTHPVLVLDDEADAATPDTTLAARSAAKPSAPQYASTINRLVVANDRPEEEGFSLGEMLPHSIYIQVTATPNVLLLQKTDADMRPTKSFVLEAGEGYCGGAVFFGEYDVTSGTAAQPKPIVVIGDNEAALMARSVPAGLRKSIDFFVISSCARATLAGWPARGKGSNHLSHTSVKTNDHDLVANQIGSHINDLRSRLRNDRAACNEYFAEAYTELQRSLAVPPPLDTLIEMASAALRQVEIIRINSKADEPRYGPRLNFIIGGNILGRGLTIDDLIVTYYIREAKTSQMDTVWQHARMFGYRESYIDYVRVYLPHRLGVRFLEIHEAEEALRREIVNGDEVKTVLIRLSVGSRATRPNALEAGALRTIRTGRDQIHPYFLKRDPTAAASVRKLLEEHHVPVQQGDRLSRATPVPFPAATEMIRLMVTNDDDPGLWEQDAVLALLRSYEPVERDGCHIYVREVTIDSPPAGWHRGRLSGPEVKLIRDAAGDVPALALLYRGNPDEPVAWYPTLVLPRNAPAWVFAYE
jgi:cephalosporin hydroxylase